MPAVPDLLADCQRLLDDQVHTDHVGQHGVLLAPKDVVDLLIDLSQTLNDLVHLLVGDWFREYLSAYAASGRGETQSADVVKYYEIPMHLTTDDLDISLGSRDDVAAWLQSRWMRCGLLTTTTPRRWPVRWRF